MAAAPPRLLPGGTPRLERRWLALALAVAALGAFWFIRRDAAGYLTVPLHPAYYTDYYWPRRYGILLHVACGVAVLGAGLLQVGLGLSGRTGALHRALGRLYVLGVAVAAAAAVRLLSAIPVDGYSLGLMGLCAAWVITTARGYWAVRHHDIRRHRAWMLRSYLVTFGFVTLRVSQNVMLALKLADENTSVAIAAWLCWTVPLLSVEIVLALRRAATASPREV